MRFLHRNFLAVRLLWLLGLLGGLLNGLLGAGGGIILVAGLRAIYKGKLPDPRSVYVSAIAVMLPLSALSAWRYATAGHLPSAPLHALLLPALAGGATGALLLRRLAPRTLARLFAAVVLVSGVVLVI